MRSRRFYNQGCVAAAQTVWCPASILKGLLFRWDGTNNALQTATLADLGAIILMHKSRPICTVSVASLFMYSQLRGGFPQFNSAIGGAVDCSVVLPLCYGPLNTVNLDDNVVQVDPNQLSIQYTALSAVVFAACNIQISALLGQGVTRYIPMISEQDVTWSAMMRPVLDVPNLRHVLMTRPSVALPDSVMLSSGQPEQVLLEDSWDALEDLTNMDSAVEAAVVQAVMPDLGGTKFASWVSGGYQLQFLNAAGSSHLVQFGALPVADADYRQSVRVGQAILRQNLTSSPQSPSENVAPTDPRNQQAPPGSSDVPGLSQGPVVRVGPAVVVT